MQRILFRRGKFLTLTPPELAPAVVGVAAAYELTPIGSAPPFRTSLRSVDVPVGWSVTGTGPYTITDSEGGDWTVTINGDGSVDITNPSVDAAGEFTLRFALKDAEHYAVNVARTVQIVALPLEISGTLDNMTVGDGYADLLAVSGGIPPYTVIAETVPDGIDAIELVNQVSVSGVPTGAGLGPGSSFPFTVSITVEDSASSQAVFTQGITITVDPLTLTGTPADAAEGVAYSYDLARTGGAGALTVTGSSGLPSGVTASITGTGQSSTVRLSGTPAAGSSSGSPYSPVIDVEDAEGNIEQWTGSLDVAAGVNPYAAPDTRSGLTAWIDGTDPTTLFQNTNATGAVAADNDPVNSASDKSGGNYWTRISLGGAAEVRYREAVVNGRSILRFGTTQYALTPSTAAASSNYVTASAKTMTIACRLAGPAGTDGTVYNNTFVIGNGRGQYFGLYAASGPSERWSSYNWDGNADSNFQAHTLSAWAVVQFRHGSGVLQVRVNNGAWQDVSSGNTSLLSNNMVLGRHGIGSDDMDLLGATVYNVALSDTDADEELNYFMWELGLI